MKVLVNALSVTNRSGTHVLAGHLGGLTEAFAGRCEFVLLSRAGESSLKNRLAGTVEWVHAPERCIRWPYRACWEYRNLGAVIRQTGASLYFTPNGMAGGGLTIPQIVFCQNPWALVPAARRWQDAPKAVLQRYAYRNAMSVADVMVFNSRFMRGAYRRHAGHHENHGCIVYQAVDDETHKRAVTLAELPRKPGQVVCVSEMAPHKNIETVLRALDRVRTQGCHDAYLVLAGSWPDPGYARRIRRLVSRLGLVERVRFAGRVSNDERDRLYADSMVFCLMSRCESFGIPAVEAQLFGTPVITSNVCAAPEICGSGGVFFDPDDAIGVANAMQALLRDSAQWHALSKRARDNAARFTWRQCSQPLIALFRELIDG